jgi:hypothetical protein
MYTRWTIFALWGFAVLQALMFMVFVVGIGMCFATGSRVGASCASLAIVAVVLFSVSAFYSVRYASIRLQEWDAEEIQKIREVSQEFTMDPKMSDSFDLVL